MKGARISAPRFNQNHAEKTMQSRTNLSGADSLEGSHQVMINAAFAVWVALRITRWISWVSFLAYSFAIHTITADRSGYLELLLAGLLYTTRGVVVWPTYACRSSRSFRTNDARAGGHRETRLLPPDAAKSAPFELTGNRSSDQRRELTCAGPDLFQISLSGFRAHQPSRPKHERLAAIVRKAGRSPYSSPGRS